MSAAAAASDNFYTVKQVNSMAQSHVGSKIIKPVYFKILSDRDLKQHNVLLVGDSPVDSMEIEFDPSVLQDMIRKSRFLFPLETVKALTKTFSWNSVATF